MNILKWFSGSTQPVQPAACGFFGAPQTTTSTGFGGGFGETSLLGGGTLTFKPARGTTTSQFNQFSSGFGTNTSSTAFRQPQVEAAVGTTIKFAPMQGTDYMMKNGVLQNISKRHQVSHYYRRSFN